MFTNFENMPVQPDKAIRFFFPATNITLRNRKRLKFFLNELLRNEKKTLGYINFIFCSDKYLLNINRKYLKHDYYTDIVTFDLSSNRKVIEAEIYLSVDRIRDNAKRLQTQIGIETYRVMFHGILHLCGYEDKGIRKKLEMRAKEDEYIANYKKVRFT